MAMTSIGPTTLNIVVPALPQMANRLASDVATIQLTVTVYLLALAAGHSHGAVVGPLRPPAGDPCGFGADRRGEWCWRFTVGHGDEPHRRARLASARRLGRPGGEPRHHPRPVRSEPRRIDDRPRRHRHGGGCRRSAPHESADLLEPGSRWPAIFMFNGPFNQRRGGDLCRHRAAGRRAS